MNGDTHCDAQVDNNINANSDSRGNENSDTNYELSLCANSNATWVSIC